MSELRALRERVENADTTDPIALGQIANEIAEAFYGPDYTQEHWAEWARAMTSIDAAVALIDRLIPAEKRFFWQVGVCSIRDGRVVSYSADTNWTGEKEFEAKTPALALIAALLNALENDNG